MRQSYLLLLPPYYETIGEQTQADKLNTLQYLFEF